MSHKHRRKGEVAPAIAEVRTPRLTLRSFLRYFAVALAAALITSFFWYFRINAEVGSIASGITPLRQSNDSYQFIDPLVGYNLPDNVKQVDEYATLENDIQGLMSQENASGSAPDVYGVYFRDLSSARWMGVNENTAFAPGSLMKVALMIAYYEEAETDPGILQQKLTYSSAVADQLNGIPFETPSELQVGQSYTVEQLIESMIESSDNGAKNALLDNIGASSLGEVTTDLGLPYLDTTQNYDTYSITPKEYSVILRELYNATYLDRQYSEQALLIMSHAEYAQGLVAGVPSGTTVAQKFGEAVSGGATGLAPLEITLSNCGIIYYSSHPYILCVMTQGKALNNLTNTIASISHLVWVDVGKYATAAK